MELDRALELAVVSSWEDLVKPGETCSVHVEYKNTSDLPLNSLEVILLRHRIPPPVPPKVPESISRTLIVQKPWLTILISLCETSGTSRALLTARFMAWSRSIARPNKTGTTRPLGAERSVIPPKSSRHTRSITSAARLSSLAWAPR